MIYRNGVGRSGLLSGLPDILHGYSDRTLGDGRIPENTVSFVKKVTGNALPVVGGAQVHAAEVAVVDDTSPRTVAGVDALVTVTHSLMLEVHVADCVPLLFADPKAKVLAVAHAGWKGTLAGVVKNTIARMQENGAAVANIYASIGPHIGRCCYVIERDRAEVFRTTYGDDPRIVSTTDGSWYLDIGYLNRKLLQDAGVPDEHIDAPVVCTSCQIGRFYSFRKDTRETFGEIIGIIGFAR